MAINCINESDWQKGDYRPAAAFNLEMDYFEDFFQTKAIEYYEDGLGAAKALLCESKETQYYVRWLELAEKQYKTDIYLLYPFLNGKTQLEIFMKELKISDSNLTWKHEDI